jgi:hypothetical protein
LVRASATVTIDGRRVGVTPLAPLELSEGSHVVILKDLHSGSWRRRRVTIRRGHELAIRLNLPLR